MALNRIRLLRTVKKLRSLVSKMDRQATPDNVHDLRTNSRRFETIFEALSLDAWGVDKSLLKSLSRYRKRAGKVRDTDVLIGHASAIRLKGEEGCIVQLLASLGARREKYARKLESEVSKNRASVRGDLKNASAALVKLLHANGQAHEQGPAPIDLAATAEILTGQLAEPRRLNKANLHSYRLKIKELLNLFQITSGGSSVFVRDLGRVKDAIGEWHDWEELVLTAQEVLDHGTRCKLLARFKRNVEGKYERALLLSESLRKKYVQSQAPGDEVPVASPPAGDAIEKPGPTKLPPRSEKQVDNLPLSTSA